MAMKIRSFHSDHDRSATGMHTKVDITTLNKVNNM